MWFITKKNTDLPLLDDFLYISGKAHPSMSEIIHNRTSLWKFIQQFIKSGINTKWKNCPKNVIKKECIEIEWKYHKVNKRTTLQLYMYIGI